MFTSPILRAVFQLSGDLMCCSPRVPELDKVMESECGVIVLESEFGAVVLNNNMYLHSIVQNNYKVIDVSIAQENQKVVIRWRYSTVTQDAPWRYCRKPNFQLL